MNKKNKTGFTFVEVMAALTFVAILLPVALKGISLTSSLVAEIKRREQALSLAQNLMTEIISPFSSQATSHQGDFSPEFPEYRWKVEILDREEPGVKEVRVTVSWTAKAKDLEISLTTLIYQKVS
ncbi:MAG: type II secretion system GspH family protein [Candidatus Omnitrophica bacterium]|nr:type II secretion system GspH family protein [Candidatus Omnitrophota bacterium]MCM8768126.1 type II secretion system GspH family protein [Candidatus Omnitrophota bacterium]